MYHRPLNKAAVCKEVDLAVRQAVNEFRFELHGDYFWDSVTDGLRGLVVGGGYALGSTNGRWLSYWQNSPDKISSSIGYRCAAEVPY